LRREERHLGGLVRTNIDCESCHRTLSSTMGVPQPKAEEAAGAEPEALAAAAPAEPEPAPKPASRRKAPAARAAAKKAAPRKTAAVKKTRS